jgi:hypothetical protein
MFMNLSGRRPNTDRMGEKNRFVQDTEVLLYRLNHGNVEEASRLLEHIALAAEALAAELEEGPKKRFLTETSDMMAGFRERVTELDEQGADDEEIASTVLDEMDERFNYDIREFSFDYGDVPSSVDWETTADELLEDNAWLRRELEASETDYMELYTRLESDWEAIDPDD